jgi:hypothetical protein
MKVSKLTVTQKMEIANELLGSCSGVWDLAYMFLPDNPFDGDMLIEIAANEYGVYLCTVCGWWGEEHNMNFDDGDVICGDCYAN